MTVVRAMRESDLSAVAGLEKKIFSRPWSRQGFLDALCRSDTVFLAAEEAGEIVGYIGMYAAIPEGEITNVAVAPEKRGRGIGGMLLGEMKKKAAGMGVQRLLLEVRVSNRDAIRLYEKNGFLRCGIRKNFYDAPKEDAYIMINGQ